MLASESSCATAVGVLVQGGADLHIVDSLGHDVLHYAKLSGSSEVRAIITTALHQQQSEPGDSCLIINSLKHRSPSNTHQPKERYVLSFLIFIFQFLFYIIRHPLVNICFKSPGVFVASSG